MSSDELDPLEADSSEAVDSDYESVYSFRAGDATTSVSLATAVTDYPYEHGRRYHAYREGTYLFPNDDQQAKHMDIAHHCWVRRLKGELYLAPIENPQSILDLGTGTGVWVLDMAEKFPTAAIIGNDLSPIQPNYVPRNVTFEVDDFNDEWTYPEKSFDFVHARSIYGSVNRWPKLLNSALRVLKPNGWFESMETDVKVFCDDGSLPEDSVLHEWTTLLNEACEKQGRTLKVAPHMRRWMEEAGFVNVQHKVFKVPIGPWPKDQADKEVGYFNLIGLLDGTEGFTLALFTRLLGWTGADTKAYAERVKATMSDKRSHAYIKVHFSYGQRSETWSKTPSPKRQQQGGSKKSPPGS